MFLQFFYFPESYYYSEYYLLKVGMLTIDYFMLSWLLSFGIPTSSL